MIAKPLGFSGEETSASVPSRFGKVGRETHGEGIASIYALRAFAFRVPSTLDIIFFGGEVDPSDRGHEGAGGFENDMVVLEEKTGVLKKTTVPVSREQRGPDLEAGLMRRV
jgi:hypothetical protein